MSRLNLELENNLRSASRQGTLISIIDRTITAMGGRQLKQWLRYPLLSVNRIGRRLDAVEEALAKVDERRAIAQTLTAVYDLERLNSKIVMGHANARDLLSLGRSLTILPPLWELRMPCRATILQAPFFGRSSKPWLPDRKIDPGGCPAGNYRGRHDQEGI